MISQLLSGASSIGASDPVHVQRFVERPYVIAQVDIIGTATVVVEGRNSDAFDWVALHTFTAPGAQQVTAFPEIRFNVTEVSGSVDAGIAG